MIYKHSWGISLKTQVSLRMQCFVIRHNAASHQGEFTPFIIFFFFFTRQLTFLRICQQVRVTKLLSIFSNMLNLLCCFPEAHLACYFIVKIVFWSGLKCPALKYMWLASTVSSTKKEYFLFDSLYFPICFMQLLLRALWPTVYNMPLFMLFLFWSGNFFLCYTLMLYYSNLLYLTILQHCLLAWFMLRTCRVSGFLRQTIQFLALILGSPSAQNLSTYFKPCSSLKASTSHNIGSWAWFWASLPPPHCLKQTWANVERKLQEYLENRKKPNRKVS